MKRNYIKNIIYTLIAIAAMWAGWLIAYRVIKNDYILPSFTSAVESAGELLSTAQFWTAFFGTLGRTAAAFCISFAAGLLLAVLSVLFKAARGIIRPIMSAVRILPTLAVILLLLLWTSPAAAPIIVVVLVCLPMAYNSFLSAFDAVSGEYLDMCRAYKIGLKDKIFKAYIPLSMPYMLDEGGAQLSLALKIMVSAEVLSKTYKSLGGMMSEAKMYVEISTLMALTLIVVIVGALLELAFQLIKTLAVRWRA